MSYMGPDTYGAIGATIEVLRQQGKTWHEIGQRLGTTENAARHTHRRWRARGAGATQLPDNPVETTPPSADRSERGRSVYTTLPAPRPTGRDSGTSALKTDIDLARASIAKVTRAEIRLKHSLLADAEINEVLKQRLLDFNKALQDGRLPSVALELVVGE